MLIGLSLLMIQDFTFSKYCCCLGKAILVVASCLCVIFLLFCCLLMQELLFCGGLKNLGFGTSFFIITSIITSNQ
jgi:hypothetical protein